MTSHYFMDISTRSLDIGLRGEGKGRRWMMM
jgi:hypothetical protein